MDVADAKGVLHRYLQTGRDALLWKLDGLAEYDVRRPMVRTGTNLLGLVKHLAGVEAGYFGAVFDRPFEEDMPWSDEGSDPNADMWATADETREQIVEQYRRVWAHADSTIGSLDLDSPGSVPWWPPDRNRVTLNQILVHVVAETHRHAGQADILRELIDGTAGLREDNDNLPPLDDPSWAAYRDRLEQVARDVADRTQ